MVYEYLIKSNKAEFLTRVSDIAARLGIDPDWLMIVMKMESNIDPAAVNRVTNATGLIQFMPLTAAGLGTSCTALKAMSNIEQLDFVYKYFKPYAGRLKSVTDLYLVTFFPVALGKPDNYILQTDSLRAATIARQNPIFDLDKSDSITVAEFKTSILRRLPSEAMANVVTAAGNAAEYLKKKVNPAAFVIIVLLVTGAGYVIYKQMKK